MGLSVCEGGGIVLHARRRCEMCFLLTWCIYPTPPPPTNPHRHTTPKSRVVAVQQTSNVGGIRCDNLFTWNSVMLCLRGRFEGVYVEYVHIAARSCRVKEGDLVAGGDVICETGDVGFCPRCGLG